ncbi:MAG TPA: DNA-formamidopyrimidine glycosylase family protein [Solirubrobacteraceae bacterium]|nr:DNA-formamidopyrimidine glycosylase family protein [Solirubrobacteraceae bacterium]
MPELPEAERARGVLERVLERRIVAVDDSDTYVTRPHQPGEIASALLGHSFAAARRRGKFLWVETHDGPTLGLHLGMAGRLLISPHTETRWDRFSVDFADGSRLVLRDKRRLGRAVLNPDHSHIGPDAAEITRAAFRTRIGAGRAPIKARLLDQGAIAGVGNLLADEVLWQAQIAAPRRTDTLSEEDLDRLRRELRKAIRYAIAHGGVHTLPFVKVRRSPAGCPRDGAALERATIGGRTTYWCPVCQV